MQMLAVPNFCFFCFGLLSAYWIGFAIVRRPEERRLLLAAVASWYLLEVARWFEAVWRLSGLSADGTFLVEPVTYVALCVLLLPLLATSVAALACARQAQEARYH